MASKCPVCDSEIKDKGKTVKVGDRTVTVCCSSCAEKVNAEPKKYAVKA